MKKIIKQLFLVFIVFTIVKAVLSYYIPAPSAFSDEYIYSKAARTFFNIGSLSVHSIPFQGPPIYPILISLSYIFQDMNLVYLTIKIINSIISSLIIFPSFLLAREFLSERRALLSSILISLLPSNFSFSPYIMIENLFYPLFLFSTYFLYKSYFEQGYKWNILAGVFIGLSYLTKGSTIILIPIIFILFLINSIKTKKISSLEIKQKLLLLVSFTVIVSPWLLRNASLFGFSLYGILGNYANDVTAITRHSYYFPPFLNWILLYIGYYIIAAGIIFPLLALSLLKLKDKRHTTLTLITFSLAILAIIITANHSAGELGKIFAWLTERPVGRYLDMVLPLFIITGFIGFNHLEKNKKLLNKILLISSLILAYSSLLTLTNLFPVNNLSLTYLGSLKYLLEFLIYNKTTIEPTLLPITFILFILLLASLPLFFIILNRFDKLKLKTIVPYLLVFFLLISLLNYGATYYNATVNWHNQEQMQLGIWFNSYEKTPSNILFDERDCTRRILKQDQFSICEPNHTATIIGFWLNHNIKIGPITNLEEIDYVISRHELDLPIIKQTPLGIFLYKTI